MIRKMIIALAASTVLLYGASDEDAGLIQKGDNASTMLLQKLGGELKKHMSESGPIGALDFCSNNALALTQEVATSTGTQIKRVSINNRNPINQPTVEEKTVLERWNQAAGNGHLPPFEVITLANGKKAYLKPIVIQNEACLKCHGNVSGEVESAIKRLYPEDKATGYKMGDLRGAISVTLP